MNADLKALVREKDIQYFLCSFVEMSGIPKAKLVPVSALEAMINEGAGFAGFAAGHLGQGPHSPDLISMPDMNAMIVLPWRRNTAWVPGMLEVSGQPTDFCPRRILAGQLQIARNQGYELMIGVEPEFMLLKRDDRGNYTPSDPLDDSGKPCYDMRSLHRNLDVLTEIVGYLEELGWQPSAADHEDANCQFEINWAYADALTTCDRQTFFKWMVKVIAERHGLWATFMPKPFANLTGNGAHFHMSLSSPDSGRNLFCDAESEFGLSQEARWFMGGLLAHARGLAAVLAPTVNSYKRLVRGSPRSGATWAPVYTTYGNANRTQMIRIPGPGRIENRIIDGAANPYLASAAMLACGLDGIAKKTDPGPASQGNLYETPEAELRSRGIGVLPATLHEAIECFRADEVVRASLGAEYSEYFLRIKSEEWESYHNSVSRWEIDNYLSVL